MRRYQKPVLGCSSYSALRLLDFAACFGSSGKFLCDQFLGMNLQRFAASDGTLFVGRAALMDTMGDLLTNTIGAALMGLFAWSQSKKDERYFESYKLEKVKNT